MPVVEAAASFVHSRNSDLAHRIEQAMSGAALQAHAEGISDPAEVKRRMMTARQRVKYGQERER